MSNDENGLSFRVSEAPRARCRPRPDPARSGGHEGLDLEIGDAVSIAGRRTTVARAMPAHAGMRKKSIVQMDGLLRLNAGASLDETVTLKRTTLARAPLAGRSPRSAPAAGRRIPRSLLRHLDGIPFAVGDRIRRRHRRRSDARIHGRSLRPGGPVTAGPDTHVGF